MHQQTIEHLFLSALIMRTVLTCVKQEGCPTWGVTTAGGTGAADAVLQPGAVGEGVPLVWRPGR